MRYALILFLICTPALASAPGEPADCNDWQLLEPGLGCEIVTQAFPCNHGDGAFDPWCHLPLAGVVLDNLEAPTACATCSAE